MESTKTLLVKCEDIRLANIKLLLIRLKFSDNINYVLYVLL